MLVGNDAKELYEQTNSPITSLHSPAPSLQSHSPTPPLQSPSMAPIRTTLHDSRSSLNVTNGTATSASNGLVHTNGVESEDSEGEDKMEVEHNSPLYSPHSDCGEYPDSFLIVY